MVYEYAVYVFPIGELIKDLHEQFTKISKCLPLGQEFSLIMNKVIKNTKKHF